MTPSTTTGTLERWREAFRTLDDCPWPGPRPLNSSDEVDLLIGRDDDRDQFLAEVQRFRLVLLTGGSGVGKTSLIEAGLVPHLRSEGGYTVSLCRDWSGGAEETDPVQFLAAKVRRGLIDGGYTDELPDGPALFWELETRLPGEVVLVLDQFEELIRDAEELTEQLFPLLVEINHRTSIRIVISFRSEYIDKLRPLEGNAKPFTISHIHLTPVEAAFGEAIVLAANGSADAIDHVVAERIAARWSEAYGAQTGRGRLDRFGRVGILHLQALLYSLHGQADGRRIESDLLDRVDTGTAVELFSRGMQLAITQKLNRCREAARTVAVDGYLAEGAWSFVARSVEHLSSVGYKLVRGVHDLWLAALEQQAEVLPAEHEALLHSVTSTILLDNRDVGLDLIDADRAEFARLADGLEGSEWADLVRFDSTAAVVSADPREVTCGPMFGLPPAAVLIEELRRYAFALEWLQASSLIRISTPGHLGATISLIHDGFGAALERWSDDVADDPRLALSALTAPRGGEFIWLPDGDGRYHPQLDGLDAPIVLPNLRWKGAWVRASFRNVRFVNCDFRGAGFDQCTFNGVSFVNCLLDGAMFSSCLIEGRPGQAVGGYSETPPEYELDAPAELLASLAHYRGLEVAATLLSPLPGLPAVPAPKTTGARPLTHERGGLTIYGGRISSLVLRANRFSADGLLSFREVAGSGVEIVEQSDGTFEIAGSRLRHITLSARQDAQLGEHAGIDLVLSGSVVAQVWLSDTVGGTMRADDCTLVQVWNGGTIDALATNCAHFDLVNVEVGDNCAPVDPVGAPATLEAADKSGRIRDLARGMDYRRDIAATSHMAVDPG